MRKVGRAMILMAVAGFVAVAGLAADTTAEETREQRDARMAWWREAKFGMFIHWGVYAVPAGTYKGKQIGGIGEWIMNRGQIPVAEYKAFAPRFTARNYDPDAWAALAKAAGMRYMVITSKHHDGFALFDSKVTTWDAVDASGAKRDLIKPLAEAARKQGLKFGLYYSQAQDWTHPGGAKARYKEGQSWDEANKGNFDNYLKTIAIPQTREILTQYSPDILWWDTPTWMTTGRATPLHKLIALRPGLITNNRLGGGYRGDTETPEQHIPATGYKDRDWETCMTMNGTWGFKSYDHKWKSTKTLLQNLVDIVSKGGNYLLNVGPTAEGEIPQPSIDRLHEVGAWMAKNGDAIYGTSASPCRRPEWGRITSKAAGDETTLYLHVFNWPAGAEKSLHVPIANEPVSCALLVDPARTFSARSGDSGITISLQGNAPDPIASVIALKVRGTPESVVYRVPQKDDGTLQLVAAEAQLHGGLKLEQKGKVPNIGFWISANGRAEWTCVLRKPGTFDVVATYAAPLASRCTVEAGGEKLAADTPATGAYETFSTATLGRLTLEKTGPVTVTVRPVKGRWKPVNLQTIVLKPVQP